MAQRLARQRELELRRSARHYRQLAAFRKRLRRSVKHRAGWDWSPSASRWLADQAMPDA
jgi:hypothetical protein